MVAEVLLWWSTLEGKKSKSIICCIFSLASVGGKEEMGVALLP